MAKTRISEYDSTANNNTDVASVNIDEGCAPSGINNAIRAVMAHLKDFQQGTNGDSFNGPHNGTVGATTPAAGTFTTLATTGNTTLGNDSGDVITINGSTSFGAGAGITGNLTLSSGTANGVAYLNGSKVLTTGSALTFDGSGMTIGAAASASTRLTVNGPVQFNASTDTNTYVGLQNTAYLTASGSMVFGANSAEGMRLTSTGLGIGTSSPGNKLTVSSPLTGTTPRSNSVLRVQSEATGRDVNIQLSDNVTYSAEVGMVSGNMYFATAGTERARIDSSGNVCIGTTSALAPLTLYNASNPYMAFGNTTFITYLNQTASDFHLYTNAAYPLRFGTNNTERMRIDSSGNLLINTTSGSYKLTLNGQPGANGYTAWTNYSDARLKENVTDFVDEPILEKICSLRPVTFNYNEASGYDEETRSRRVSGFIAQELQEVFPEMVGEFGKDGETYLDTNLSNLTLYLLQAIKELKAEVDALKSK